MGIAAYIKQIGRGSAGARAIDREQARDLMGQVLDGTVTDLEIGAFALAMRIKGETVDELLGFADAVQARLRAIPSDRPVVVIPSYNGARRLPNLTPLLALLLAQAGARVLVHGPHRDPTRVTSAEIFEALGLPLSGDARAVQERWSLHEPAFIATEHLCAPLQRLLDVRWVVGVRNSGHSIAKLLQPITGAPALCLTSYTHPEFARLMAEFAQRGAANLVMLRGTEGEVVADPRRCPKIDTWIAGVPSPECSCPAQEGSLAEVPLLAQGTDAASTAVYIQAVLGGERPAPAPLQRQVELLTKGLQALERPR